MNELLFFSSFSFRVQNFLFFANLLYNHFGLLFELLFFILLSSLHKFETHDTSICLFNFCLSLFAILEIHFNSNLLVDTFIAFFITLFFTSFDLN